MTVPASPLYLNYNGVQPGTFQVTNDLVNGTPVPDSNGQLQVSLGTAPGATDVNPGFLSYCLDDLHRLTFGGGEQFQVVPKAITAATNGVEPPISADRAGRIAFLYNHFGDSSLNNIQGPGAATGDLGVALRHRPDPRLPGGNFQVVSPDTPFTDQATLDQVLAQASAYFNLSAGKSESALLLDATPFQAAGVANGSQSMIAQGSFNFANTPTTHADARRASPGSSTATHNHDGMRDSGDMPIAGASVALTGTDQNGQAVKLDHRPPTPTAPITFRNLTPGVYTITLLTAPPGFVPAVDTQGTPGNGTVAGQPVPEHHARRRASTGWTTTSASKARRSTPTKLQLLGIHHQQSQIVLHFNGPLDAAGRQEPGELHADRPGQGRGLRDRDDVRYSVLSAAYDPSNATVTLTPVSTSTSIIITS